MPNTHIELMTTLEGLKVKAYDCTAGKRTVGIGFNMEQVGARKVWDKLEISENFDEVYNQTMEISQESAKKLFDKTWKWCIKKATQRATELDLSYGAMPEYKKFLLADIVYNTGSISNWSKVLLNKEPESVLYEARRNPKEIMDSRVAKIGYQFKIIKDLDDAKKIGLEFAKYLV